MQADERQRVDLQALAHGYLDLAQRLLSPRPARVVAIGGLSGSGKSTLARALAPHVGPVPGAVLVRSDELRKRLFGVSPLTQLGADGYTPGISQQVYGRAAELTERVALGGHGAVVDAVFAKVDDRDAIARRADAAGVPFTGLWLEASEAVRLERTTHRGPDASDATAEVVRRQRDQLTGAVTWHRLDASQAPSAVLAQALKVIGASAVTGSIPSPWPVTCPIASVARPWRGEDFTHRWEIRPNDHGRRPGRVARHARHRGESPRSARADVGHRSCKTRKSDARSGRV